jgi:magnesium-transporting ATPase (P-type)
MLTGDKLETAINVAYSSNLIKEHDTLITVSNVNDFSEGRSIKQLRKEVSVNFLKDLDNPNVSEDEPRMCMAISGEVLWVVINEP